MGRRRKGSRESVGVALATPQQGNVEGPFILTMCRLDANIKLTSRSIQQVLPLYISSRDPSQS